MSFVPFVPFVAIVVIVDEIVWKDYENDLHAKCA